LLDSIITSKTRLRIILKLFLNPETTTYLRSLAEEFAESTNGIRIELNRLTDANLLTTSANGRTKLYRANKEHPLFPELHSLTKKNLGIDRLIDNILAKLGSIDLAFITGDYAHGIDSGLIDLIIVGKVKRNVLHVLVEKAETLINRKIRPLVLSQDEFNKLKDTLKVKDAFLVWGK